MDTDNKKETSGTKNKTAVIQSTIDLLSIAHDKVKILKGNKLALVENKGLHGIYNIQTGIYEVPIIYSFYKNQVQK